MVYIFGWWFKFINSPRKFTWFVLGLGCVKDGAPQYDSYAI